MVLCVLCDEPIESPDGLPFTCDECGLEGLCESCARVGEHVCEDPGFFEDEEYDLLDDYDWLDDPPDDWLEEPLADWLDDLPPD